MIFNKKNIHQKLEKYYTMFINFANGEPMSPSTLTKILREMAQEIGNIKTRERDLIARRTKDYFLDELAVRQTILEQDKTIIRRLLKEAKLHRQSGRRIPRSLINKIKVLDQKIDLNEAIISYLDSLLILISQTISEAANPQDAWTRVQRISQVMAGFVDRLVSLRDQYNEMQDDGENYFNKVLSKYGKPESYTNATKEEETIDYEEYEKKYDVE